MDLHRFSAFDYMKLIVGSALVAAAFQFFTFPNSIVSGGVTGIAQIIHLLTRIPVGVLSILINIPIFYLGWRHRLGTRRRSLRRCAQRRGLRPDLYHRHDRRRHGYRGQNAAPALSVHQLRHTAVRHERRRGADVCLPVQEIRQLHVHHDRDVHQLQGR